MAFFREDFGLAPPFSPEFLAINSTIVLELSIPPHGFLGLDYRGSLSWYIEHDFSLMVPCLQSLMSLPGHGEGKHLI